MKFTIENNQVMPVMELLLNMPLKGKQSRQRSKMVRLLEDQLKEIEADYQALLKEHCHLDKDGNPKKTDNDTKWDIKNLDAFKKDHAELYEEQMEIVNREEMLRVIKTVLDEYDEEMNGTIAMAYDYLCDRFDDWES